MLTRLVVNIRNKTNISSLRNYLSTNVKANQSHSIKGSFLEGRPVYMDFQATTPMDPRVLDVMLPYMVGRYGNPHSRTHSFGWETEAAVENARGQIADLIGAASPKEVIFTSGATESNNLALKGVANFYRKKKNHIITLQTEHKCILDTCRYLENEFLNDSHDEAAVSSELHKEGYKVSYLPVQKNGIVNVDLIAKSIADHGNRTGIVSVMGVNNEIGVIQPLQQIGELCRANNVFFHSDIAQMAGKVEVDVEKMKIDLASISSHKMYGPKGIGALFVRRKQPRVRLTPLINGGGQERGLRSGTLAPALCIGMGHAAYLCKQEMDRDRAWLQYLSNKLRDGIVSTIPRVTINGDEQSRYCGNLNVSFAYVEGESLLMALKNIAVSSGSACTSASLEPSYVLRAIGTGDDMAHSSIRFGIGRFTTEAEVDFTLQLLQTHVKRLREMSPLWEMVCEGIDLNTIEWTQDHHHH